jgi:hypothetical protein
VVIYVSVIFGIVHFTAVIMPNFFELTGFNDFMIFLEYLLFISSRKMSSDNSPPKVRQRVEESIADRNLRMEKRQVLSERNLLHADLRDPVLLLIGQII